MDIMQVQPKLFLMPNAAGTSKSAIEELKFDFKILKPSLVSASADKPRASWPSFLFVIAMHVGILMLAIYTQKKDQLELPAITPMMVSLLDAPQNQPVSEPQKVETPKTEPQKQKPVQKLVVEKKAVPLTTDKPSPVQPVQEKSDAIKQEVAAETKVNTSSESHVADSKPAEVVDKAPQKVDVIEPPKFGVAYLNNPAPNYPGMSRRSGEQGQVMLRVLVSATGEASTVEIEKSSQFERLDQAALEAVKKWRFVPAKKNNQPLSAYVLVPVRFSLDK
jgi:protein TonB